MLDLTELSITRGRGEQQFCVTLPELQLNDGEILAITGMSGCGKSTLLEMIGLILKPDHLQSYQLGGNGTTMELAPLILQHQETALSRIRAEKLGFMLQNGGLLPFLTVQQNIVLPCESLGLTIESTWCNDLCERLNVAHLMRKYPHQLSIGERQRVAFIRSVIHQPALLLADEPTSALDPYHAEQLLDIMMELVQQKNIAALLVTHDWALVQPKGFRTLQAEVDRISRTATFKTIPTEAM